MGPWKIARSTRSETESELENGRCNALVCRSPPEVLVEVDEEQIAPSCADVHDEASGGNRRVRRVS